MSIKISLGNKKKSFKSIKIAAQEAGVKYITFYMRLRNGDKTSDAFKRPVRRYTKTEKV
jgi:hypothetical protein